MDPQLRSEISMRRLDHYYDIMRTSIFAYVAIAAVIGFGAEGVALPLIVLVLVITTYGVLAGKTALEDVENLRGDMTEEFAQTSFAQGLKARNLKGLILTSNVLLSLIGLSELIAIVF
ncbi:hypothetical protein GS634_11935 [Ruegeria atlantica]|uniref:Uncharacterized protein n=1 Tax=Ruegeria atlantica TaxID=81569 RepID=A0AA90Z142_9RHOB|nr:hypothetical protein [Ruegeria atlantica]NOE18831.1 hypothetical protein [Ruegeria atlantica]